MKHEIEARCFAYTWCVFVHKCVRLDRSFLIRSYKNYYVTDYIIFRLARRFAYPLLLYGKDIYNGKDATDIINTSSYMDKKRMKNNLTVLRLKNWDTSPNVCMWYARRKLMGDKFRFRAHFHERVYDICHDPSLCLSVVLAAFVVFLGFSWRRRLTVSRRSTLTPSHYRNSPVAPLESSRSYPTSVSVGSRQRRFPTLSCIRVRTS